MSLMRDVEATLKKGHDEGDKILSALYKDMCERRHKWRTRKIDRTIEEAFADFTRHLSDANVIDWLAPCFQWQMAFEAGYNAGREKAFEEGFHAGREYMSD